VAATKHAGDEIQDGNHQGLQGFEVRPFFSRNFFSAKEMMQFPLQMRHYGEWLALRAAMRYVRKGDFASARVRVRRLSGIARRVLDNEWAWALKNLHLVFGPTLGEQERARLAAVAFEQHLLSYVEGLRDSDVEVKVVDEENAIEAYEQGRGVLVCSIHLGSWEPGVRWSAGSGYPIVCVYRPAHNPRSDREFQVVRASYGIEWVRSDDLGGIAAALRARKFVLMMTDLNTLSGGVAADFLGVPAMCPVGPAVLALEMRCPIVPCIGIREDNGVTKLHFEPPIQFDPTGSTKDVARLTRRINQTFEPWVLNYAEQYNWLHPRWRARPDGSIWKASDRVESMWAERIAPFPSLSDRVQRIIAIQH
jgi:Kdo2-lipid IVA lauroyltransferase/acyltransferase